MMTPNNFATTVAFLALLAAVALVPSTTEAVCSDTDTNDIVSQACDASNAATFSTLCTLLTNTGIGSTSLVRTADFVVFAPTNTAFANAGNTAGTTIAQRQNTLRYHIYPGLASDFDIQNVCGNSLDSQLVFNDNNGQAAQTQTSLVRCTGTTFLGQQGDVNLPFPNSAFPKVVGTKFDACNGQFFAIDNVMGFDRIQYNWNGNGRCSFFDPNCLGAKGGKSGSFGGQYNNNKGGKGAKGGVYNNFNNNINNNNVVQQNIFNRVGKGTKGGYGGQWSNLNQFQTNFVNPSAINNNFNNNFNFNNGGFVGKAGKGSKGGYYNFATATATATSVTILCPGQETANYCDCSSNCSLKPENCQCADAQLCCTNFNNINNANTNINANVNTNNGFYGKAGKGGGGGGGYYGKAGKGGGGMIGGIRGGKAGGFNNFWRHRLLGADIDIDIDGDAYDYGDADADGDVYGDVYDYDYADAYAYAYEPSEYDYEAAAARYGKAFYENED